MASRGRPAVRDLRGGRRATRSGQAGRAPAPPSAELSSPPWRRIVAVLALVGAFIALLVVVFTGGSGYTVHAYFENAGQLVTGDQVEVGGVPVGTVTGIELTSNAAADVTLGIADDRFKPLHGGTTATIRAVGLIGVANRYVALTPGPPSAPALRSGAVIDETHTNPIVDLDQVLDSIDAPTRQRIRAILRHGASALNGVSEQGNAALHYLNPALSQTAALTGALARDQLSFQRLVRSAARVTAALASQQPALGHGLGRTAAALGQVAAHRTALEDALHRAPPVLVHTARTLRRVRDALQVVPTTLPLVRILRAFGPALAPAVPVTQKLRAALPSLRQTLLRFPRVAHRTIPTIRDLTETVHGARPIFSAFRPYAPDLVNGFYGGLGNKIGGYYDANGDYVRIAALQGAGGGEGLSGLLSPPTGAAGGYRTGLTARCPGGAVEPAPDRSNPFIQSPSLCDPGQDHREASP